MSKKLSKNKITLISLAVALVLLVVVYFVFIAPLIDSDVEVPTPQDGEGIYNYTHLTVYEPLEESQLISIHIKNQKDEYTFKRVSNKDGTASVLIDGYEKLIFDETYYAYLNSYALAPLTVENQVFRNCTPEQLKEYGVTPDTCQATMTVKFTDKDGTVKSHTLYIGHAALTASPSYYVGIEGRSHVYRFSYAASGSILIPLADYISPIVYSGYASASEALIDIKTFIISKGQLTDLKPYIVVTGKQIEDKEGVLSVDSTFHILEGDKILKSTAADYDYALNAMALFYTNFYGDKVIAINPDKDTLKKYGLDPDAKRYVVSAQGTKTKDLPTFFISDAIYDEEEEADFYYTVAYQSGTPLLVRIPKEALIPQNQFKDVESVVFSEEKAINWAATNTIGAGFSQAIQGDGVKYTGVKALTIKLPKTVYEFGEETFYLEYVYDSTKETNVLKVTTKSGRYTDTSAEKIKPFNQFYYTLISYPIAVRFNEYDDATIEAIMANPDNHMYTIEAILNPKEGENVSTVQRFEYYKINGGGVSSSEYVIMHVSEGNYVNGEFVATSEKTVFDTTRGQIADYIYKDFLALMNGTLETK